MLKVVQSPDPLLSTVCEPCDLGDKSLKRLSTQMAHTMYKNNGVGIAAPQVGVLKRLIVVDCDWDEHHRDPLVLVNPELVDTWGDPVIDHEGCLSVPGVFGVTRRPARVTVRAKNVKGEDVTYTREGITAVCFCHELDHLDGILFRTHVEHYLDPDED